ncbi:hypothetical protein BV898_17643 [Hypsibius exemplaris]|uniref:Uncharacterized protein n=1 Tax=Hypsibius exemplaris TaxID=2072580 RepID=A0A9X6RMM6_HYPEX|nr:hypothetical protein BV898_17643 [Hypsibius exemplaris]
MVHKTIGSTAYSGKKRTTSIKETNLHEKSFQFGRLVCCREGSKSMKKALVFWADKRKTSETKSWKSSDIVTYFSALSDKVKPEGLFLFVMDHYGHKAADYDMDLAKVGGGGGELTFPLHRYHFSTTPEYPAHFVLFWPLHEKLDGFETYVTALG